MWKVEVTSLKTPLDTVVFNASLRSWTRYNPWTLSRPRAQDESLRHHICQILLFSGRHIPVRSFLWFSIRIFLFFSFWGNYGKTDDCFAVWCIVDLVFMSLVLNLIEIWKNALRSSIRVRFQREGQIMIVWKPHLGSLTPPRPASICIFILIFVFVFCIYNVYTDYNWVQMMC